MKNEHDELYQLVQQMDQGEKRYFKITVKGGAGRKHGNYIQLFDALEEMETYDPAVLKEKLQNSSFMAHLSPTRSRLMATLLKSLRLQGEHKSLDGKLGVARGEIDVLIERGLIKTARKRIQKAKELALAGERYAFLLQLLDAEIRCFSITLDDSPRQFFPRIEAEQQHFTALLELKTRLQTLHETVRSLNQREMHQRLGKRESLAHLQRLFSHELVQKPVTTESLLIQTYQQNISGIHFIRLGQFDEAYEIYLPSWKNGNPATCCAMLLPLSIWES